MRDIGALGKRVDRLMVAVTEQAKANEDSTALNLITASLVRDLMNIGDDSASIVDSYTPEQQALIDRFAMRYNAADAKVRLLQALQERNEEEIYEGS